MNADKKTQELSTFILGRKRNFDLQGESAGFRDRLPVFGHALQVKFDRLPDVVRDFLDGLSGGDASWPIGDKSGHVVGPAFHNYSVLLHGLAWLGLQSRWSRDTLQSHRRLQERQNQNGPPMNADKHFVFNLLDQIRPLREGSTPIRWFLE